MRTFNRYDLRSFNNATVGMKPLSERDENHEEEIGRILYQEVIVGMKPLSERDEN